MFLCGNRNMGKLASPKTHSICSGPIPILRSPTVRARSMCYGATSTDTKSGLNKAGDARCACEDAIPPVGEFWILKNYSTSVFQIPQHFFILGVVGETRGLGLSGEWKYDDVHGPDAAWVPGRTRTDEGAILQVALPAGGSTD